MKIAVRMDDVTPDMDWDAFYRVKEILDRAGIKPLLGIVPDNQDPMLHKETAREDFWEQMRALQAEGWCMALHGMNHVYTTKKGGLFPLNHFSEYAGLPYDQQEEMIARGKKILNDKGIAVDVFMAPGHSYDRNTLKALAKNEIRKVTDGFGEQPYLYQGITFYPISFKMSQTLKKEQGYSTLVLHANTMTESDFETFEKRVEGKCGSAEFISYSEYLALEAKKVTFLQRLEEWTLATMKNLLVRIRA